MSDQSTNFLKQEHDKWRDLFRAQPALVQRFIEAQAGRLADALLQKLPQTQFSLPDQVVANGRAIPIPQTSREQFIGGVFDRLTRADVKSALVQRFDELEQSDNPGVAAAAGLMRYATAVSLVRDRLPSGRAVRYLALPGEEIPSAPESLPTVKSAITEASDAIAEEPLAESGGVETAEIGVQVPYVEAARCFYLPQFVAFDDSVTPDRLLVNSAAEAQAHVASMQKFLSILHTAIAIAPYMTVDPTYQGKRYGILGQLVNQARALARHQARDIIAVIKRRAAADDLNRGLSLSLPYFDDGDFEMHQRNFQVIPAGRIRFAPAFVVRAARLEAAKIAQDTRLSPSTRKHLLVQLSMLEKAFEK